MNQKQRAIKQQKLDQTKIKDNGSLQPPAGGYFLRGGERMSDNERGGGGILYGGKSADLSEDEEESEEPRSAAIGQTGPVLGPAFAMVSRREEEDATSDEVSPEEELSQDDASLPTDLPTK